MVNVDTVNKLFQLFSGQAADENADFIIMAREELKRIVIPDIPEEEIRLNFLCAALANYRYQQAKAAQDSSEYTYAGRMRKESEYTPLAFARNMLKDYYDMCRDIVKPQSFVFFGFSKESDTDD